MRIRSPLQLFSLAALSLLALPAAAQDDGPVDIEVGSRRIGGPGTSKERSADAAWDKAIEEEETPMTEETLPPKGDKKRLPGLHKLARQYFGGKMWKDACEKYDMIVEEEGDAGLDSVPDAKKNAARSWVECAQIAFNTGDYELTERLLKKGERAGAGGERPASIRRRILKESYHKAVSNGDMATALMGFKKYQAEQADEDERIWMGERIAELAVAAYASKDKVALKELIRQGDEVAPMNTELRKLKERISDEENVFKRAAMWGVAAIALVVIATQLSRWRARSKVQRAAGGAFGDHLDEEV